MHDDVWIHLNLHHVISMFVYHIYTIVYLVQEEDDGRQRRRRKRDKKINNIRIHDDDNDGDGDDGNRILNIYGEK